MSGIGVAMTAAPGWYPDPNGSGRQFFWNGQTWSVWTGDGWAPGPPLPPPHSPMARPSYLAPKAKNRTPWIVLACVAPVVFLVAAVAVGGRANSAELPGDQKRLIGAVDSAAADYKNAGSDLRRSVAADNAPARWCAALSGPAAVGWVGEVKAVDTTIGYATLRIDISKRAEVHTSSTWPLDRQTLIPDATPLYNQVANLKVGQKVRFSGNFVPGNGSCIRETSVTNSGKAETPDFLFQFTSVETL